MKKIRCHYCGGDVHVEDHVSLSLCGSCKVKAGYSIVGEKGAEIICPVVYTHAKPQYVATKREPFEYKPKNDSDAGGMLLASCLAIAMANNDSQAQSSDASASFGGGESGGGGAEGSF
jgi:uncharacterized membrane protein YgcG